MAAGTASRALAFCCQAVPQTRPLGVFVPLAPRRSCHTLGLSRSSSFPCALTCNEGLYTLASPAGKTCHRLLALSSTRSRLISSLSILLGVRYEKKPDDQLTLALQGSHNFFRHVPPCITSSSLPDWPPPVSPPPKSRRPFTHEPLPNLPGSNGDKRPHSLRELRTPRPLRRCRRRVHQRHQRHQRP